MVQERETQAMNVRWWSALQPVSSIGWCALVVQHHMWIVLAALVLRWVMVSGTILMLVLSVDKADRANVIGELAPVLQRLSVLVTDSPRATRQRSAARRGPSAGR
jgi:energy-converting hydrogenase Eha subunit G